MSRRAGHATGGCSPTPSTGPRPLRRDGRALPGYHAQLRTAADALVERLPRTRAGAGSAARARPRAAVGRLDPRRPRRVGGARRAPHGRHRARASTPRRAWSRRPAPSPGRSGRLRRLGCRGAPRVAADAGPSTACWRPTSCATCPTVTPHRASGATCCAREARWRARLLRAPAAPAPGRSGRRSATASSSRWRLRQALRRAAHRYLYTSVRDLDSVHADLDRLRRAGLVDVQAPLIRRVAARHRAHRRRVVRPRMIPGRRTPSLDARVSTAGPVFHPPPGPAAHRGGSRDRRRPAATWSSSAAASPGSPPPWAWPSAASGSPLIEREATRRTGALWPVDDRRRRGAR